MAGRRTTKKIDPLSDEAISEVQGQEQQFSAAESSGRTPLRELDPKAEDLPRRKRPKTRRTTPDPGFIAEWDDDKENWPPGFQGSWPVASGKKKC